MDPALVVDIELTNRCNADCYFCPRDATPDEGLMTPEIFDQALRRAVELHETAALPSGNIVRVNLCGLGEPLINKHAATFAQQVTDAGLEVGLSSNGALLDERRSQALLDAGVCRVFLNVGERDEEYEKIYKLPWARTRDNVVRFAEMAKGRCDVYLVLVNHRRDAAHVESMRTYWQERGITLFTEFEIMNRGGSLFVDHMEFESYPEVSEARELIASHGDGQAVCSVPFLGSFIGYDGNFYLCCSDWKKEAPVGNVFDSSFTAIAGKKLEYVLSRDPVCRTCNLDPVNVITEELRAGRRGEDDAKDPVELAASMTEFSRAVVDAVDALQPGLAAESAERARATRNLIPVRSA